MKLPEKSQSKKDIFILTALVLIHIVFLYIINNYLRRPETYRDELIFIGVAKSLVRGKPFMVHEVPIPFTNVLYPLIISPAFLITDTLLRLKVVTLINCVLISLTLFPVYFICRELGVKRDYTWIVIGLMFFWPDMAISGTLMSENLYFPLVAFTALFIIKAYRSSGYIWPLLAGVFSYLLYNCKEVGLCLFLGYISVEAISALLGPDAKEKWPLQWIREIRFKHIAVYVAAFGVCYALVKFIFLAGNTNPYMEAGSSSLKLLADPYVRWYLFYAMLYYAVTVLIAFFVLPIAAPLVRFKELTGLQKKTFLFGLFSLLYMIVVIGVMICIKEVLGEEDPVVHLRYLFPLTTVLFPAFFALASNEELTERGNTGKYYHIWALVSLVSLFVFKGLNISCTTGGLSLLYSYDLSKIFYDIMGDTPGELRIYPAAYIIVIVAAILVLIFIRINSGKSAYTKKSVYCFAGIAFVLCLINFVLSCEIVRDSYGADGNAVAEMRRIDEYFRDNNLTDTKVMYVGDWILSYDSKVYDFYFDSAKEMMATKYDEIALLAVNDGYSGMLYDVIFLLDIWETPYHTDTIDYFIVGDGYGDLEELFTGLERVDEISGAEFTVYKNVVNDTLEINK